jgi:deoxyribose-phosphate aldolase
MMPKLPEPDGEFYSWLNQYRVQSKSAFSEESVRAIQEEAYKAGVAAAQTPPPWWPAVENILNEYGLQAIDFVADFKKAKDAAYSTDAKE